MACDRHGFESVAGRGAVGHDGETSTFDGGMVAFLVALMRGDLEMSAELVGQPGLAGRGPCACRELRAHFTDSTAARNFGEMMSGHGTTLTGR